MEAVDISQLESFEAGCLFAQVEGIIPAPESCHAIAAAIREANKCKENGEEKVILFKDRKSTRLNSSHMSESRMPSSA